MEFWIESTGSEKEEGIKAGLSRRGEEECVRARYMPRLKVQCMKIWHKGDTCPYARDYNTLGRLCNLTQYTEENVIEIEENKKPEHSLALLFLQIALESRIFLWDLYKLQIFDTKR